MTTGIMGLRPEDFFTDALRDHARDLAVERMGASDWFGYAIDAPPVVELGALDVVPVLGVRRLTAVDCAAHDFQRNAVVVAVRVESNEVFAGRAFEPRGSLPSSRPRKPPPVTVIITDAFELELRSRLPAIPWAPGTYRVHVLVLDCIADPVDVRLTDPSGRIAHPGASRHGAWPPVGDKRPPQYTRADATPATPAAPGISMVVERVVLDGASAWCLLRGSFRLPVTAGDVPEWTVDDEAPTSRLPAVAASAPMAKAYAPVTLLLTGSTLSEPWTCALVLPSDDAPCAVGDTVTGCFTLNLFELPGFPRAPGAYYLWAFSGTAVAGPEPIALAPELATAG